MDHEERTISYLAGVGGAALVAFSDCDDDLNVRIIRASTEFVSWGILSERIAAGCGDRMIGVGDRIPVTLKNGEEVVLVAVHANPYWQNSMVFAFEDCLGNTYAMNRSGRYEHGYETCDMRKYLNNEIFQMLPDELATVIQPRTIRQKPYDGAVHEFSDRLWLMSRTEVFGETATTYREIGAGDIQFDYYKKRKHRIKILGNTPYWWWLRTPSASNGGGVRIVRTDGSISNYSAYGSSGVAPACVIGAPEPNMGR